MGLFSKKDWNVIAVIFERHDLFCINGNRAKGKQAVVVRDGAKNHDRTVYWAVFDQKRSFVEGAPGPGCNTINTTVLKKLIRDLPKLKTVQAVLIELESASQDKISQALEWDGYGTNPR
jgi:hypothetical protein